MTRLATNRHARCIVVKGRNSIDPPAPLTPWQRERRDGPLDGSERLGSILWPALIAMLVICVCAWIMANGWSW